MKIKKILVVLLLCLCVFHSSAQAKSTVWKISKDGNHLFVGGTLHVLSESDYPLPQAFEKAYEQSELLVFETDMQKFKSPEFQLRFLQKMTYPSGVDITQFLRPITIKLLKRHLTRRDIPLESLKQLKPGMLSSALTVIEMQRKGLMGTGVDEFFRLRALEDKKELRFLETVDEQADFIANMGLGNEDMFVRHMLKDLKFLKGYFESMKKVWRSGDNAQIKKVGIDPWAVEYPKVYNTIIKERNDNWIPAITQMLETREIEFVLFGALHLVGEDGVIEQLKNLGYTVENQ